MVGAPWDGILNNQPHIQLSGYLLGISPFKENQIEQEKTYPICSMGWQYLLLFGLNVWNM